MTRLPKQRLRPWCRQANFRHKAVRFAHFLFRFRSPALAGRAPSFGVVGKTTSPGPVGRRVNHGRPIQKKDRPSCAAGGEAPQAPLGGRGSGGKREQCLFSCPPNTQEKNQAKPRSAATVRTVFCAGRTFAAGRPQQVLKWVQAARLSR